MNNLKILAVDDDQSTLDLLEKKLKKEDYAVETAKNGTDAVRLISKYRFDVVLTDLMMPGGPDGIAVLEAAKERYRDTEVILITAHASVDNAVKAMKKGASDYLQKPMNFEELFLRLEKIYNLRTLVRDASDLREAMDVTEATASETIQKLEMQVAMLKQKLHRIQEVILK